MEKIKKKYVVKLNSLDKIETLLQETYNLACQQHTQIQAEINKIVNSTTLKNIDIDGKEKYAKAINNYMALQQKSISQKMDIAKLMTEVVKHNGDVKKGIENTKQTTFDIAKLRELAKNVSNSNDTETEEYTLKGRN